MASIDALRPVFMIVMGAFLLLIGWRLSQRTQGMAARLLRTGSVLLGFGYSVLVPLYEAKVIPAFSINALMLENATTALIWHVIKLLTMNVGWLLAGTGLAIHARLFETARSRAKAPVPAVVANSKPLHETAA